MSILVPKRTRRDFLEVLRKYYRVFHVNSVQDMGDGRVMVTVVKNFRDFSVIRVIEELGGIFRANLADSGLETWEFAVTRNRQGEALLRLKELLSMKDFQVMEFRLFKEPKFTESELKVLRKALEPGYFDYPRRANSAEVRRSPRHRQVDLHLPCEVDPEEIGLLHKGSVRHQSLLGFLQL